MTTPVLLGIDVGSTNIKVVAASPDGTELLLADDGTPWVSLPHGRTEMAAESLVEVVSGLLERCVAALVARVRTGRRDRHRGVGNGRVGCAAR